MSLCLLDSFCGNREQKVNIDLLPFCKQRLLERESWGTDRKSVDMLQKLLKDSDMGEQEPEAME